MQVLARGLVALRCGLSLELGNVLAELFNLVIGLLLEFIEVIAQIIIIVARPVKIAVGFVTVLACLMEGVLQLVVSTTQRSNLGRERASNMVISLCLGGEE